MEKEKIGDVVNSPETRQGMDRYPDLGHPTTTLYLMAHDGHGPIRIGAKFVKWNESLIGVTGNTWKIIDW